MKIRRKRRKAEDEETSYWLSYSDMMAGLLLVFVLIISFTMLQAKSQYEAKEIELAEKVAIILSQEDVLTDQEDLLADQQSLLDQQKEELDAAQAELDEQKSVLETLEALLEARQIELENTQYQLEEQQEELDRIIGVKADLIKALGDRFAGTNLSVSIDSQTGAITLDASVLFDTDEYYLKESGQDLLREFVPIYIDVLLSDDFRDYVSEIIIEGHTDTEGTYIHNLELSQQRALSVATFCLTEDNGVLDDETIYTVRDMITANGKSFSDPVYYSDGTVDMDSSRRVEFKFRLKDEEMVQEMIDVLSTSGTADLDEY